MPLPKERLGETLVALDILFYSAIPLILTDGTGNLPKIMFLGLAHIISATCLLIYLIATKNLKDLLNKKAWPYMINVAIFLAIIPLTFIGLGTSLTDGITAAIFLQTEVLFAFIICGIFFNEKITKQKILGSLITLIGTTAIIYNGSIDLSLGSLLIILGVAFYPIGNINSKKAMNLVSQGAILFIRASLAAPALILISLLLEPQPDSLTTSISQNLPLLLFTGIIIYFATRFLWYGAIKRIEITKAVSMNLSIPAVTTIFSIIFLSKYPTTIQILGFLLVTLGLYTIIRKQKANPSELSAPA